MDAGFVDIEIDVMVIGEGVSVLVDTFVIVLGERVSVFVETEIVDIMLVFVTVAVIVDVQEPNWKRKE